MVGDLRCTEVEQACGVCGKCGSERNGSEAWGGGGLERKETIERHRQRREQNNNNLGLKYTERGGI